MIAPLANIRVLEVDSFMAAPSAGAVLADLGADVLKVEPLGGDPMRGLSRPLKKKSGFAGYDFQFDVDNRGKRSLAVALDRAEGAALVRRWCCWRQPRWRAATAATPATWRCARTTLAISPRWPSTLPPAC